MVSPEGRTNFQNQLKQLIGSIQYSNDYDVHTALILAPSYAKTIDEKYYQQDKNVWQRCREYVDLFGIMQKNANALDLIIEEAKATLRSWGSQDPSFMLTNSKLTMQMTMTPEKTSYVAHGLEGQKLLKQGPSLPSYRGLNIINSRSFATEEGKRPRDMLDRRVRVAEYYIVKGVTCDATTMQPVDQGYVEMYDQSKNQMFRLTFEQLYEASQLPGETSRELTTLQTSGDIRRIEKEIQDFVDRFEQLKGQLPRSSMGSAFSMQHPHARLMMPDPTQKHYEKSRPLAKIGTWPPNRVEHFGTPKFTFSAGADSSGSESPEPVLEWCQYLKTNFARATVSAKTVADRIQELVPLRSAYLQQKSEVPLLQQGVFGENGAVPFRVEDSPGEYTKLQESEYETWKTSSVQMTFAHVKNYESIMLAQLPQDIRSNAWQTTEGDNPGYINRIYCAILAMSYACEKLQSGASFGAITVTVNLLPAFFDYGSNSISDWESYTINGSARSVFAVATNPQDAVSAAECDVRVLMAFVALVVCPDEDEFNADEIWAILDDTKSQNIDLQGTDATRTRLEAMLKKSVLNDLSSYCESLRGGFAIAFEPPDDPIPPSAPMPASSESTAPTAPTAPTAAEDGTSTHVPPNTYVPGTYVPAAYESYTKEEANAMLEALKNEVEAQYAKLTELKALQHHHDRLREQVHNLATASGGASIGDTDLKIRNLELELDGTRVEMKQLRDEYDLYTARTRGLLDNLVIQLNNMTDDLTTNLRPLIIDLENRINRLEGMPSSIPTAAARGPVPPAPAASTPVPAKPTVLRDFVIVRPVIEHQMLGIVMGRGGKDELGCTFWGQTELSVYDDSMHGLFPSRFSQIWCALQGPVAGAEGCCHSRFSKIPAGVRRVVLGAPAVC
jgi:hypothetical protein